MTWLTLLGFCDREGALLVVTGDGDLQSVSLGDGTTTTITSGVARAKHVYLDGGKPSIVVQLQDRHLPLVVLANGARRAVTAPGSVLGHVARRAPTVTFTGSPTPDHPAGLHLMDLVTGVTRLLAPSAARSLAVAPDGGRVAFAETEAWSREVTVLEYIAGRGTTAVATLDRTAGVIAPEYWHDSLLLLTNETEYGEVRLLGTERRTGWAWPCQAEVSTMTLTAKGILVVVVGEAGDTRLMLVDIAKSAPDAVVLWAPPIAGEVRGLKASNDGSHVAAMVTTTVGDDHLLVGDLRTLGWESVSRKRRNLNANVAHGRVRARDQRLIPSTSYRSHVLGARRGTVVLFHGGPESRHTVDDPLVADLAELGFDVEAPDIRGSTGYGKEWRHLDEDGRRLDALEDACAVVRAVRRRDRGPVVVVGSSWGGFVALWCAIRARALVDACVAVSAFWDVDAFLADAEGWGAERVWKYGAPGSRPPVAIAYEELSPDGPPLLLVHGTDDPMVAVSHSRRLVLAAERAGQACRLVEVEGAGHEVPHRAIRNAVLPFLLGVVTQGAR